MAHSTSSPAAQQTPKTQFDWYTFLRKAFINGLKTYGAALMVAAPEPALNLPKSPSQVRTCNQEIFEKRSRVPHPSSLIVRCVGN